TGRRAGSTRTPCSPTASGARGVRVAEVPEPAGAAEGGGALVVLSAPRAVAAELAAASAASGLAVILC
ncbi:hypothetical protein FFZ77_02985, partial [Streptomyces katsurahamanus]|nr:hypothetical protein [Streptomyces katsurahamanus]